VVAFSGVAFVQREAGGSDLYRECPRLFLVSIIVFFSVPDEWE
jgi:hypothetical protein